MSALPKLLSVVELGYVARRYGGSIIGDALHQSLPIPLQRGAALQIGYLFGRAEIITPGAGLMLWAPTYVAEIDAQTGKLQTLRQIRAEELGEHTGDGPLGSYLTLAERLQDAFMTAQARCYQSLDALLPLHASAAALPQEREGVHADTQQYLQALALIEEVPWRPCYRTLGRAFFDWLNALHASCLTHVRA